MTLDEAHLELLDYIGEEVAVGIKLPGDVPWAGGQGILNHAGRQLAETARGQDFQFSDERDGPNGSPNEC